MAESPDVDRVLRENAEAIREADEVMERLAGAPERAREYAKQIRLLLAREREARERAERRVKDLEQQRDELCNESDERLARAEKAEARIRELEAKLDG